MKKILWQVVLAAAMALLVRDFGKPSGDLVGFECTRLNIDLVPDGYTLTVDDCGVAAWINHPEMGRLTLTTSGPIYPQLNNNLVGDSK